MNTVTRKLATAGVTILAVAALSFGAAVPANASATHVWRCQKIELIHKHNPSTGFIPIRCIVTTPTNAKLTPAPHFEGRGYFSHRAF